MLAVRLSVALLFLFTSTSLADRPKCGSANTNAVERREVSNAVLANPHYVHLLDRSTLVARARDPIGKWVEACDIKNLGSYMEYRILGGGAKATTSLLEETVDADDNKIDLSTTTSKVFGSARIRIGTGEVSGCTVVTVVSTRAVYMGHFWENLSMENDVDFEENFMNLFFGGTPQTQTTGPAIDPSLFNQAGDRPIAFIMSPRALAYDEGEDPTAEGTGHPAAQGIFEHATQLNQLRTRLEEIIPGIIIEGYGYEVTADGFVPGAPFRLALFEYDPKADAVGPNWRLWQEDTLNLGRTLQGFGQPAAGSSSSS
ncbi:hypothetical protein B0A48_13490 [Cryoendolithus antarcticus]|uniref:Uncharacterized protein n=1 Tax=Cryoendolithus antarcticus TaxID=1507870 RepID=A0A1V8SNT3_9PEZI|nr:hypothetical protein B0A48_13490 [Cryoendolithus antarcticus]